MKQGEQIVRPGDKEETEGWGVIRPGDRKAHYYIDGTALCRKVGYYNGPLDPDEFVSKDDCAPCRKKLEIRKKKAQNQKV